MRKNQRVQIGSKLAIEFDDGFKSVYRLVNPYEANISEGRISVDSPFGKAVFERMAKEKISYLNPSGEKINCEIIEVR